jgi:septal ring factor EnvC (AmiA/AmiB activator)
VEHNIRELHTVIDTISSAVPTLDTIAKSFEYLSARVVPLLQEHVKQAGANAILYQYNTEADKRMKELVDENKQQAHDISQLSVSNRYLTEQIQLKDREKAAITAELEDVKKKLTESLTSLTDLQNQYQATSDAHKKLLDASCRRESTLKEIEAQLATRDAQVAAFRLQANGMETQLADLRTRYTSASDARDEVTEALAECFQLVTRYRAAFPDWEALNPSTVPARPRGGHSDEEQSPAATEYPLPAEVSTPPGSFPEAPEAPSEAPTMPRRRRLVSGSASHSVRRSARLQRNPGSSNSTG